MSSVPHRTPRRRPDKNAIRRGMVGGRREQRALPRGDPGGRGARHSSIHDVS